MEGLIPYVIRAIKRQTLHKKGYRCLSSTTSRHDYDDYNHLLAGAMTSVDNGSSHGRGHSEFRYNNSGDYDYMQSHVVKSSMANNKESSLVSRVQSFARFRENKVHYY
ncbi:hypothetical protein vseg_000769 [Gypsophila vaccaria]